MSELVSARGIDRSDIIPDGNYFVAAIITYGRNKGSRLSFVVDKDGEWSKKDPAFNKYYATDAPDVDLGDRVCFRDGAYYHRMPSSGGGRLIRRAHEDVYK